MSCKLASLQIDVDTRYFQAICKLFYKVAAMIDCLKMLHADLRIILRPEINFAWLCQLFIQNKSASFFPYSKVYLFHAQKTISTIILFYIICKNYC